MTGLRCSLQDIRDIVDTLCAVGCADVYVYSDGLDDAEIRAALLTPTRDLEATLAQLQPRRLCVLPEGPLTIAFLNGSAH